MKNEFFSENTVEYTSFGLGIALLYYLYERGPDVFVCMIFHWIQCIFEIPHPYPLERVCSRPAEALFVIEWQKYLYQQFGLFGLGLSVVPLYLMMLIGALCFAIPIHLVEQLSKRTHINK